MITGIVADVLPSVETQNMEVSFASANVDTTKLFPVSNQLILYNQEQAKRGKPDLRRKKNNIVYFEFSDSEINDISDEGKTFILKRMSREERHGSFLP
jgi:hypothetical protein